MEADRRKQDIATLRQMLVLQNEIDEIIDEIDSIEVGLQDCDVDPDDYKTDREDETQARKTEELAQLFAQYEAKEKAATAKAKWIFWGIFAVGILVAAVLKEFLVGVIIVIAAFIVKKIMEAPAKKQVHEAYDQEAAQVAKKYEKLLEEAKAQDDAEQERYENDFAEKMAQQRAEAEPELKALEEKKAALEKEYEQIRIVSQRDMDKDPDIIDELLDLLESHRADNIKEALLERDREKRRLEQERQAAIAAEAARKASMPGKVYVRIGSINTYSGALQTVANNIYVDGASYGAGNANGSVIQLNPGPHNIYAQLQEAGYIFTTPTYSFYLEGEGSIRLKIMIKNAVPMIIEE